MLVKLFTFFVFMTNPSKNPSNYKNLIISNRLLTLDIRHLFLRAYARKTLIANDIHFLIIILYILCGHDSEYNFQDSFYLRESRVYAS